MTAAWITATSAKSWRRQSFMLTRRILCRSLDVGNGLSREISRMLRLGSFAVLLQFRGNRGVRKAPDRASIISQNNSAMHCDQVSLNVGLVLIADATHCLKHSTRAGRLAAKVEADARARSRANQKHGCACPQRHTQEHCSKKNHPSPVPSTAIETKRHVRSSCEEMEGVVLPLERGGAAAPRSACAYLPSGPCAKDGSAACQSLLPTATRTRLPRAARHGQI